MYSDAGLVCANMRWYEPAAGRFLSTDPSGTAGGLNLYEYSNQSPVNYVDATGLEPKSQEFINKVMRRGNVYVGASAIYWGGMGVTGFNCGGDTFCAQTGERPRYIPPDLAIAGLSKLGSLRFDLVDPRFRPQIGDVADLSDHCATVVDFVGGHPILYGRDGDYGVYSGPPNVYRSGVVAYYRVRENSVGRALQNRQVIDYRRYERLLPGGLPLPTRPAGVPDYRRPGE